MIDKLKILASEIGAAVAGLTYCIDIINACGLSCPSCPQGNVGRRDGHKMSLSLWQDILAKGQKSGGIRRITIYSFSDPMLHPQLPLFVKMASDQGIPCIVSTPLAHIRCSLYELCKANPAEIRVSFPGFEKYGYYHRGGRLETVLQNIETLQSVRGNVKLAMHFHVYRGNKHETEKVRAFAHALGWELVELDAIFLTLEKIVRQTYTDADNEIIREMFEHPQEKLRRVVGNTFCYYQNKEITLDARGRVYVCCNVYGDEFLVGDFMADSVAELRKRIKQHPFCRRCIELGGNRYYY